MAKRLKLKLSRVIPSLQFCRSKHPSTSAQTPLPALYRLSPFNPKTFDITYPILPAPPPSTPEDPFVKRHVLPKAVSLGCGCLSGSCTPDLNVYSKFHETKHSTNIYDASSGSSVSPVWVNEKFKKKLRNKKEKKTKATVPSRDSGFFSSQEEDEYKETDTLISASRSFSNDSSEENTKRTKKKVNTNIKKIGRLRRYASKNHYKGSLSPDKSSILKRMIPCSVEGKVRESVAVVKKSEDPYEDFKRSMLEMILEKQMFEAKDLEELLQCFLSLNSRQYHRTIVDAFSYIWGVLFSDCSVHGQQISKPV
ncbi:hypothetical protein Patl1_09121 [Pistacia atlantica]|uniref:Uncharacterized protein n=1 Tax=Pistacia atlantica TaxID=434234 RepID=A0ACC1AIN6_9ROSI|nr:hypothetical protein Patl1_09121 [Pistacia atlantica]